MRDYRQNPLKFGELIPQDEFYRYYIIENHSLKEALEHYNISKTIFRRHLKVYGIKKPKNLCKIHRDKTCLEKFGVKNIFEKTDYIKEKTKEKLGVENASFLEEVTEKRKKTCQDKYGGNAPACSKKIADKVKKTNQKRYGANAPLCNEKIKDKMKKTNLEKYGNEYIGGVKEVQDKIKNTNIEKYGAGCIFLINEFKERITKTLNEKYGVNKYAKTEEFKNRVKQQNNIKYGCDYFMQTEEFKEKSKKTLLDKYNVDHPMKIPEVRDKIYQTMKENGSYRKSKPEEEIYNLLCNKFKEVKRQYKSNLYPFNCDFYIPEIDLYIEFNGYQGHGKHPFNENNEEDRKLLNYWEEKSRELKSDGTRKTQYLDYIRTWTISDPIKRLHVLENNLNWLEFFSMEEFMDWYNKI